MCNPTHFYSNRLITHDEQEEKTYPLNYSKAEDYTQLCFTIQKVARKTLKMIKINEQTNKQNQRNKATQAQIKYAAKQKNSRANEE